MEYLLVLLLFCSAITEGFSAKCMSPEDARYVRSAADVPEDWIGHGWHNGTFFPSPGYVGYSHASRQSALFLSDHGNGARMWWLKDKDYQGLYMIITHDQNSILCTLLGAGLQIGWKTASKAVKRSGYCHWRIEVHPETPTMFRIFNAELQQSIPEIGPVFLNKTGLYFDYQSSASNDPGNAVEERFTWWRWCHATSEQTEMESLPDQCELGPSGYPLFLEDSSELTGRGVSGRRRRRKRIVFASEDKFAQCGGRWFLFGRKCYRIYSAPGLRHHRTSRVCDILGGKIALPRNRDENVFLRALIRRYAPKLSYWLGATAPYNIGRFTLDDFQDSNGQTLTYKRWINSRPGYEPLQNQHCVMIRGGYWQSTSCDATGGRVLCEREAALKELPGSATCGKIQERQVDLIMARAGFSEVTKERIVGGDDALPSQFPWQAAIRFKTPIRVKGYKGEVFHNCGGSLIDRCWVVSAGHCFYDRNKDKYAVRLGDYDNSVEEGHEQEFDIDELIIHEEYTEDPSFRNDIALIKLEKKHGRCAKFDKYVQPICLPSPAFVVKDDGELCQVSGWGVTDTSKGQGSAAEVLQWVTVPTMRDSICESRYNKKKEYFVRDIMFCAGYKTGGRDSCSGDSGGPYVCRGRDGRYALTGIVSFGIGCARERYPGVYTRVHHFIPWIGEKVHSYGDMDVIGNM